MVFPQRVSVNVPIGPVRLPERSRNGGGQSTLSHPGQSDYTGERFREAKPADGDPSPGVPAF